MNQPIRFKGGKQFLSNFYACRIHACNREFTSVESAYQWRKCMHHDDMQTAQRMLATRTGLQAKQLSKCIREKEMLRAEWKRQRYGIMYGLVTVKYRDPTLRKRLLDTGHSQLQEWVKSREGYWGALTYSGQAGQNMLGHITMLVREAIRLHQTPEYSQMADILRPHHAIDQGLDADTRHAASALASRARPRGDDKKARHSRGEDYISPTRSDRGIQPLSASQTTSKPFTISTSRDIEMAATTVTKTTSDQDAEMMTTLSQLEKQVGNGTYIIRRPLTIVQVAVQEKYIVYPSCQQCNKRVIPENNGYVCPIHRWQRGVVYRFAMRVLLQDAIGSEVWGTIFNDKAVQLLGYTGNDYINMTSDAERYAALDMLRGARVMVTIRKRMAGPYVNYTVANMEVVTV